MFLRLYAPISPLAELTPPEAFSASLNMFIPFSAMFSNNSSPESTPKDSISSNSITETGKEPVILAPLICEPVTVISSTSLLADAASSCAKPETEKVRAKNAVTICFFIDIIALQ